MKIKQRAAQRLDQHVRWQALKLLVAIEVEGAYSNVLLNRHLSTSSLSQKDQQLLVQLVYGTVQHRLTLAYYLAPLLKGKKLDAWVVSLLHLSVYQLVYLDRIPDHAVIHEAVQIAKLNGHQGLGNFVNAVLRQFLRQPLPAIDQIEDVVERLSVRYSLNAELVALLLAQYDIETVAAIGESLNQKPRLTARINATPDKRAALMAACEVAGYRVAAGRLSPYAIESLDGRIMHSPLFEEGQVTIQDESSMLVAPLGVFAPDMQVLDACSAPGGKATHIASLIPSGSLTALDISEKKLDKVFEHMVRLGFTERLELKLNFFATDALKFDSNATLYDMIYLDAPCSGLGLMRRKPEIKYTKSKQDIETLAGIQAELLAHCATLLRSGGTLIYSTCTITQQENEDVVQQFLETHADFELVPITQAEGISGEILNDKGQIRILPHQFGTDGFFIARLHKK